MARIPQIALVDWAPDITAATGYGRLLPMVVMLLIFFAVLEIVDRIWWRAPRNKAGGRQTTADDEPEARDPGIGPTDRGGPR